MLVIRLFRVSKRNQPLFKIVVTDKRKPPRGGRFVEEVGFLNPLKRENVLKQERIKYWLSVGAKPSDTIYNLLISEKIIEGKKIPVHKKSKKKEEEKKAPEAPKAEKPTEAPKAETPKEEAKETPIVEKPKEGLSSEASAKEEAPKEEKTPEAEIKTE